MAKNPTDIQNVVMICNGSDCKKRGAKEIGKALRGCAREHGCKKSTMFVRTKCTGLCKNAPVVCVQPNNKWVTKATPEKAILALQAALLS